VPKKETTKALVRPTKNITDIVLEKITTFKESGDLKLPKNYSPENALKAAYLVLKETKNKEGKYALEHCTQESTANALLKMVVWGLSPLKKQCDLIMYGNKLECSIEYTGNIALAKRYGDLEWIKANVIFDGDDFDFEINQETGRKKVLNHKQTLESLGSKKIKGAYATYKLNSGEIDVEIMNITQIHDSWNQGAMKGNSPAHKNFPDQMCMKTVINRACKLLIRASDDKVLYDMEDNEIDTAKENVKHTIKENANQQIIDIEAVEEKEAIEENPNF
jgi:recombination protein RecT